MESWNREIPIFWNYVNSDEEKLDDFSRPRDRYWFRMQPWSQMEKFDWKSSNKNIYLSQYIVKWALIVPQSATITYKYAYLKESYTASDFSFMNWYVLYWNQTIWWDYISKVVEDRKSEIFWSPSVKLSNGNAVITKSWTYIIQAYCDFFFPSWYNPSSSYQYKEYVSLVSKEKESDEFTPWVRTQSRCCWSIDWVTANYVWWLEEWTILNTWFLHTFSSNTLCFPALNIYRLS